MGVWIEIHCDVPIDVQTNVTPCVGVWIEIDYPAQIETKEFPSLPAWECGLKSCAICSTVNLSMGHSLRGSVD